MKTTQRIHMILLLVALGLFAIVAYDLNYMNQLIKSRPHTCHYKNCPYKGIQPEAMREALIEYNGEAGTDSYAVDSLHFAHPAASYDQLDSLLFTHQ